MVALTDAAVTVVVMGGYVAVVVVLVLVGKTVIDVIGDRVYGKTEKKRPGGSRGA